MTKNRVLWIVQVLLAMLFLFAGGVKLLLPIEPMLKQTPMLSGGFLRFVGVCEVLGGLGLVLPGLLRIRTGLTPLAAVGLIGIMIGAVWVTLITGGGAMALMPFTVGLLLVFIVYGRWSSRGHQETSMPPAEGLS
jgi:hypothetical protein